MTVIVVLALLFFKFRYAVLAAIAFALPIAVYFGLKTVNNVHDAAGVWIWFIPIPVGALLGWCFVRKNEISKCIFSIAISFMLSNFLFFAKVYPRVYGINPVAGSLDLLKNKPNLVYYKMMNPAYVFNLQRLIPSIQSQDSLLVYLQKHPDALVISRKQFEPEIPAAGNMRTIFEQKDTFENPTSVVCSLTISSPK